MIRGRRRDKVVEEDKIIIRITKERMIKNTKKKERKKLNCFNRRRKKEKRERIIRKNRLLNIFMRKIKIKKKN